jgi:hypothetical protein
MRKDNWNTQQHLMWDHIVRINQEWNRREQRRGGTPEFIAARLKVDTLEEFLIAHLSRGDDMLRKAFQINHPELTYEYLILHVFPDHFTAADKLLARSRLERARKKVGWKGDPGHPVTPTMAFERQINDGLVDKESIARAKS